MTELLYLPDSNYKKKFETEVVKTDEEKGFIVLRETCFYKKGGGQPTDKGVIRWDDNETKVVKVVKEHGEIRHYISGQIPEEGKEIEGEIDWNRRYQHMKMHTAQHLLSWVVLKNFDATTAGNQIHAEYSRIDFEPAEFDEKDIKKIENMVNKLVKEDLEVKKTLMPRERAEQKTSSKRTNFDLIPDGIDPLRMVIIGEEDYCPCGGTHVDGTGEIGEIEITDRESKGAEVERVKFRLKN